MWCWWRVRATLVFAAGGHGCWWWRRERATTGARAFWFGAGTHEVRQGKNHGRFGSLRRRGRSGRSGVSSTGAARGTCATLWVWRDHPRTIEKRFELRDRAKASWTAGSPHEHVFAGHAVVVDGRLQIAKSSKFDFAPIYRPDDPNIRSRGRCCASHLELVTACRALDRRAALGDKRVIEVVDSAAALAGDFHEATESFPCCASKGNKCAGICCSPTATDLCALRTSASVGTGHVCHGSA